MLPALIHKFTSGRRRPLIDGTEHVQISLPAFRRHIFPGKYLRHMRTYRRFSFIKPHSSLRKAACPAGRFIVKLINGCVLQSQVQEFIPGFQLSLQLPVFLFDFLSSVNIQEHALYYQIIVRIPYYLRTSDNPAVAPVSAQDTVFKKHLVPRIPERIKFRNNPFPIFLTDRIRQIPFLFLPEFLLSIPQDSDRFPVGIFYKNKTVLQDTVLHDAA